MVVYIMYVEMWQLEKADIILGTEVCHWLFHGGIQNNYFDLSTLSDCILIEPVDLDCI